MLEFAHSSDPFGVRDGDVQGVGIHALHEGAVQPLREGQQVQTLQESGSRSKHSRKVALFS